MSRVEQKTLSAYSSIGLAGILMVYGQKPSGAYSYPAGVAFPE